MVGRTSRFGVLKITLTINNAYFIGIALVFESVLNMLTTLLHGKDETKEQHFKSQSVLILLNSRLNSMSELVVKQFRDTFKSFSKFNMICSKSEKGFPQSKVLQGGRKVIYGVI
jgi:hypothetical protein